MSPEAAETMAADMFRDHQARMDKLSEKALQNCEHWASVTPKLAERFINEGDTVGKILESLKITKPEPAPPATPLSEGN